MIYSIEDELRRYCCGTTHKPANGRPFYGDPHWCACEHCHKLSFKKKNNPSAPLLSMSRAQGVCCDVLKDKSNYTIERDGFEVSLGVQHDDDKMLVKLSQEAAEARGLDLKSRPGFAVFVAPTNCPFKINIVDNHGGNPHIKFEIESMKLGDEQVHVNKGQRIFYGTSATVPPESSALGTFAERSFLFISDTGPNASPRDGSNVVRIKLQRQRQTRPVKEAPSYRSLSSITGGNVVNDGDFVVNTIPLEGNWEKDGPAVDFLIQLVNVQSDEERAADNAKYQIYLNEKLQKQIDDLTARQKRLREEADSLEGQKEELQKKMKNPVAPSAEDALLPV